MHSCSGFLKNAKKVGVNNEGCESDIRNADLQAGVDDDLVYLAELAKELVLLEYVRVCDPGTDADDEHEVLLDDPQVGQVSLPVLLLLRLLLLLLLVLLPLLHLHLLDVLRAERLERCRFTIPQSI